MKYLWSTILILALALGVAADSSLPVADGLVNDRADLLSRSDRNQLEAKAQAYLKSSGNTVAILMVNALGDRSLEDYAHDVYSEWGIGEKGRDNGVLLLIAMQEKKIRLEVGYGLEADLTDIESGRIVNRNSEMAGYFRQGEFAAGVNAAFDAIVTAIGGDYQLPPENQNDDQKELGPIGVFVFFIIFMLIGFARFKRSFRRFGGPFGGGFGSGGFHIGGGSGSSGGGGFSGFGGGMSGGGGASGGW